jgi:hypothetical protein
LKALLGNSLNNSFSSCQPPSTQSQVEAKIQSFQLTHKILLLQSRLLYACRLYDYTVDPLRLGRPEFSKGHHDLFLSKTGRQLRATANKLTLGIFPSSTNRQPVPLDLAMCRNMHQFGHGALLPRFPESALTDLGGGSLYQNITMSRHS